MSWRQIGVLYLRELRAALRERTIVVNGILIPILLYPGLMWIMFTGMTFVMGKTEGFVSRVAVVGPLAEYPQLEKLLAGHEQIEVVERGLDAASARAEIRAGDLDTLLELEPATDAGQTMAGNLRVRLSYDGSKDRSAAAQKRLGSVLDDYRAQALHGRAGGYGIGDVDWQQYWIVRSNLASQKQMGAFIMGLLLPLFLVIMVAVGCFYPAIDATAGERERNTWETLMTTAASRSSIVIAKYLYVATMGAVAGLLNLVAMTLSMGLILSPLMERAGESFEFSFPLVAIPVMAIGAILIAGFAAAGMMIFASFAKSFKEGQSLITPFYLLLIVPMMFLQSPDLKLTVGLALVPVANMMMVFREAISGTFNVPLIVLSCAVEVAVIFLCLWLATVIMRFEDVVTGSYEGNLFELVRERLIGTKKETA